MTTTTQKTKKVFAPSPMKEKAMEEVRRPKVTCVCCGKEYDYADEPREVQAGGEHICPDCWEEE